MKSRLKNGLMFLGMVSFLFVCLIFRIPRTVFIFVFLLWLFLGPKIKTKETKWTIERVIVAGVFLLLVGFFIFGGPLDALYYIYG